MSHGCRTWKVQSYSLGGTAVHSHLTYDSLNPPESTLQTVSQSFQPFLHSSRQTMGRLKIAPSHRDLDLHLIHGSLGKPESAIQTTCRSVQPFFARLTVMTDRPCYSIGNSRLHLHITRMRGSAIRSVRSQW